MTTTYRFLLLMTYLCSGVSLAQVTAVRVNNQKVGAAVAQGDTIRWTITLPNGATSMNELWIDGNGNGGVDLGVDKILFRFSQTDGLAEGDGPGDMDGTVNGTITTYFKNGLPPAQYVFVARNAGVADTASFSITPLPSPAYTVSGTVTVPQGESPRWFLIEADPEASEAFVFWMALTDQNGNYTVNFDAQAANYNPWRIGIENENLGSLIPLRRDTVITLTGNHTGVNFTLLKGKIITGTVKDQSNNPIVNANPHLHDPWDQNISIDFSYGRVDSNGVYMIAAPEGKYFMHFTAPGYRDQWWNGKNSFQTADTITITSSSPDTIRNINGVLALAALIRGKVTVNGVGAFASIGVRSTTFPYNPLSFITGTNDRGEYDLTVDPGTYYIEFRTGNQFQYVQYYNNKTSLPADAVTVTLGQTVSNINANFVITSVAAEETVPTTVSLDQNYPNPFNPTTTIRYELPLRSLVKLSVYNVLGQEVARLVDSEETAGSHAVTFDASQLASGMYIYRLTAAGVTITKKMSVMK